MAYINNKFLVISLAFFLTGIFFPTNNAFGQLIPQSNQLPIITIPSVTTPLISTPNTSVSQPQVTVTPPTQTPSPYPAPSVSIPGQLPSQTSNALNGLQSVITTPTITTPPVSTSTPEISVQVENNNDNDDNQAPLPFFDMPETDTKTNNATSSATTTVQETVKSTTTLPSVYSAIKKDAITTEIPTTQSVTRWVNDHFFPSSNYKAIGFTRETTMFMSATAILLIALGSIFALGYIENALGTIKKNSYTSELS